MPEDPFDLPITYVDSAESLSRATEQWFDAHLLAVDIECSLTGVHHCTMALVQVASHDQVWLVDPLALGALMKPAMETLAQTPWIVHDFSGDGIVFKRLYDVMPVSVLDTMMLARALGYPQPGLKTLAKLKMGLDIPKEEQDSNWMLRPLRPKQISYAARDAALLLPLLRRLGDEAEARRDDPDVAARLAHLPEEMRGLLQRVRQYRPVQRFAAVEKAKSLGPLAESRAQRLSELRLQWGNEGDVAAVMELGNRWILARVANPPRSKDVLERYIPNPRFRAKRLDDLWAVFDQAGAVSCDQNPSNEN
ncbi:MAG: hypothetical protein LWX11_03115 [Firmicutes bacterium]|nr:hypothetical protein [Bacillota bacterium]